MKDSGSNDFSAGLVLQGAAWKQAGSAQAGKAVGTPGRGMVGGTAGSGGKGSAVGANLASGSASSTIGGSALSKPGSSLAPTRRSPSAPTSVGSAVRPSASSRHTRLEHAGGLLRWPLRAAASLLLLGLLTEWLLPLGRLPQWNDAYRIGGLAAIAGLLLLAGVWLLPGWASLLLRLAVVTAGAGWIGEGPDGWSGISGLPRLPGQLAQDAGQLLAGGPAAMSGVGQAFCLLLGLSILLSALQTLVWIRQWGIGLLGLTAAYLWALSEWFGLNTLPNLARASAEGVLLAALLTLHRLKRRQADAAGSGAAPSSAAAATASAEMPPWRWWAASGGIAALLALGAAGLSAGKTTAERPADWALAAQQAIRASASQDGAGAIRQSPIFTGAGGQAAAEAGAGGAVAETGYGLDDTRLGAPLRQSDRTLFWAVSPEPLYWRMEEKTVYTGQGWREEGGELVARPVGPGAAVPGKASAAAEGAQPASTESASTEPEDTASQGTESKVTASQGTESGGAETIRQSVWLPRLEEGMPLPAAGTAAAILSARSPAAEAYRDWTSYLSESGGGAVYLPQAAGGALGYTVVSELVRPTAEQLRQSGAASNSAQESGNGQEGQVRRTAAAGAATAEAGEAALQLELELKAALQLPASLPQRVKELAASATAGQADRYGQVVAVRDYLKAHYRYSLTETEAPAPGQDLVDQFLFERKLGYCVHFSTAMAVMLRSVGIPARWVKGFAPGEETASGKAPAEVRAALGSAAAGGEVYRVSGLDAHAWVEVYFPGGGWVAFDPTPGYAAGAAQPPEAAAAAAAAGAAAEPSPAPQPGAAAGSRLREAAGAAAGRAAELALTLAQPGALAAVAALGALAAAMASPALRSRLRLALALRRYALAAGGERRSRSRRAAQRPRCLPPRRRSCARSSAGTARRRRSAAARPSAPRRSRRGWRRRPPRSCAGSRPGPRPRASRRRRPGAALRRRGLPPRWRSSAGPAPDAPRGEAPTRENRARSRRSSCTKGSSARKSARAAAAPARPAHAFARRPRP
ncbi:transglutaminase-like domain-containing protein [Paenibacillus sp. B01]|uniref:transglutaminase-like domain-containing protein n=1 Tax=Paenibacillus sp. B01 TaxID=2660554 RepID=UPI001891BC19|nr:transglutaminase-like domain-containing protein [Paenibacillus sp. B01]